MSALPFAPALPLLDARSPSEFLQGHIPGALCMPLFSDAEHAAVGTLYKEQGPEAATLHGLACVGPRLEDMARRLLAAAGSGRELAVYCSRGGMRSASLAWLCNTLGLRTQVLDGGYKAFRRSVLQQFDRSPRLLVLGGRTGSGKTEVLHALAKLGTQVLDLEDLARHRGSVFGALDDEAQPSGEHFENMLATDLGRCNPARPIWIEDESENLGSVNLPGPFLRQLRAAPLLMLETTWEARPHRVFPEFGARPRERIAQCLDRIKKRLGGLEHKRGHAFLAQNDLPGVAGVLLEYYDRAYAKQLKGRRIAETIVYTSAEAAAKELLRLISPTAAASP